jgi:hypothetical protein
MGWVHRHKRHGALFALAALVLQIAVSFGHVHIDGLVRPSHALATSHQTVVAQSSQQTPPQNPGDDDDGYCAICASIFLVSTSFVSEPPRLPVPDVFQRIEQSFSAAHGLILPLRFAFQSRAPPAV